MTRMFSTAVLAVPEQDVPAARGLVKELLTCIRRGDSGALDF
jgi:hypothetical protein